MSKRLPQILHDLSSLSSSVVSPCYSQAKTALATVISVLFNTLSPLLLLGLYTHTLCHWNSFLYIFIWLTPYPVSLCNSITLLREAFPHYPF